MTGLKAAGHEVLLRQPDRLDKNTLLIIWNRYAGNHELALMVERSGGRVLVAENGYIGAGGGTPKFEVHPGGPQPHHYYAIGDGFHNDAGRIRTGAPARFPALGVDLKPWREGGEYVLVCPNRSFGIAGRIMPPDWAEERAKKLRKAHGLPVRVRAHPGNNAPPRALADDLAGAAACYVWSSSCGVHALAAGIPTYVDAPFWIMKGAGAVGADLPDRAEHFERMAWGQWTVSEIARGEPFAHLLPTT